MERLHTGCRWTEGPAYFPAGRYLLLSDIPNDRILRWDETTGAVGVFRHPAGYASFCFSQLKDAGGTAHYDQVAGGTVGCAVELDG